MHTNWKTCFSIVLGVLLLSSQHAIADTSKSHNTGSRLLEQGKFKAAYLSLSRELAKAKTPDLRRASLLDELGLAMEHQGKFDTARKHYMESMSIRTNTKGTDSSSQRARSNLNLGRLYLKTGNFKEAQRFLNRALEPAQSATQKQGDVVSVEAQRYLAELQLTQGDADQSRELSTNALASIRNDRNAKNVDHQKTAECLSALARAEAVLGSDQRALQAAEEAIAIAQPHDRSNRIGLAERLQTLAEVHIIAGSGSESREPALRVWEIRKAELGAKHPAFARSLLLCGHSYMQLRDYGNAEKCYKECFQISNLTLGDNHSQVASALMGLACVQLAQGRLEESRQNYNRAITVYTTIFGANHNVVVFHQKLYKDLLWQTDYLTESVTANDISSSSSAKRLSADLDGAMLQASVKGIEPKDGHSLVGGKELAQAMSLMATVLVATVALISIPVLASVMLSAIGQTSAADIKTPIAASKTVSKPSSCALERSQVQPKQTVAKASDKAQSTLRSSALGKKVQKDCLPMWTPDASQPGNTTARANAHSQSM